MRIVCPSCAAAYDVPETRLAPGRAVRCARCGVDWTPAVPEPPLQVAEVAPAVETVVVPVVLPVVEPPSAVPEPVVPAPLQPLPSDPPVMASGRTALMAGWVLSLVVIAGLGGAAVVWRGEVMRAWPPSERLFAAIGLGARP